MALNFGQSLFGNSCNQKNIFYNFSDIARATGYIIYYIKAEENYDGERYFIPSSYISSYDEDSTTDVTTFSEWENYIPTTTDWELVETDTYDIEFNKTTILEGDVFINWRCSFATASSYDHDTYLKYQLFHYDGSTETSLADEKSSKTNYNVTSGDSANIIYLWKVEIPETKFKKGEKMRLKIKSYCKADVANDMAVFYTVRSDNTSLIALPFKIES